MALYLALTRPELPKAVISIENVPMAQTLQGYRKHIDAMKEIEDAKTMKRTVAPRIFKKWGIVPPPSHPPSESDETHSTGRNDLSIPSNQPAAC